MFKKEEAPKIVEKPWDSTQHGTLPAYYPEYKNDHGEWVSVPLSHLTPNQAPKGIDYPLVNGGILQQAYLCGYAQAHALAWGYAAYAEANSFTTVKVRVIEYDLEYDIKARKRECTANTVEKN